MANYQITNRTGAQVKAVLDKFTSTSAPNNLTLTGTISGGSLIIGTQKSGTTLGTGAIILGVGETASGDYSCAKGGYTISSGNYSNSEGYYTTASGHDSHAEGNTTTASQTSSHAEGYYTTASGTSSHAEGHYTTASGTSSHAEGTNTTASGSGSHAEGASTTASGSGSHAEGGRYRKTPIWDSRDHQYLIYTYDPRTTTFEGSNYTVSGSYALGICSHAEGVQSFAAGYCSHAEGFQTQTSYDYTHSEGYQTLASGISSHAEGDTTIASGNDSHAEGNHTIASGTGSHSECGHTLASGDYSHAEGLQSQASGSASHAEGLETVASGNYSHAGGYGTIASYYYNTAIGKYNSSDIDAPFMIGSGISSSTRWCNFWVDWDGHLNSSPYFIDTSNQSISNVTSGNGWIDATHLWSLTNPMNSALNIWDIPNDGGFHTWIRQRTANHYYVMGLIPSVNGFYVATNPAGANPAVNGIAKTMAWDGYNGNLSISGSFSQGSDRRLKNIYGDTTEEETLAILENVNIVNFSYKYDNDIENNIRSGIIAQDLQQILEEHNIENRAYLTAINVPRNETLIEPEEGSKEESWWDENEMTKEFLGISYVDLVPILIKGWQIHKQEIEELKQEMKELKEENNFYIRRLDEIEDKINAITGI